MRFSPRLHPYLIEQIWAIDDGRRAVAEIWRAVTREAEKAGLAAPGYHSVRNVVIVERQRRAARTEALLIAVSEVPRYAPDGFRIVDALATVHARRPRSPSAASTSPKPGCSGLEGTTSRCGRWAATRVESAQRSVQ